MPDPCILAVLRLEAIGQGASCTPSSYPPSSPVGPGGVKPQLVV